MFWLLLRLAKFESNSKLGWKAKLFLGLIIACSIVDYIFPHSGNLRYDPISGTILTSILIGAIFGGAPI
jgi:flagellar biosynthesis protein FliR